MSNKLAINRGWFAVIPAVGGLPPAQGLSEVKKNFVDKGQAIPLGTAQNPWAPRKTLSARLWSLQHVLPHAQRNH